MNKKALSRFLIYSIIGIIMFFVPIKIGQVSTIPLDHIVNLIKKAPGYFIYPSALIILGTIIPFVNKTWNKDKVRMVFSIINILSIPFLIMFIFKIGPEGLLDEHMIPFIFNKIVVSVCTIVPVGSIFLSLIISYGLMEFVGVFMRPVMKPVFKTPGRSAIDAVASFVGSYSIALLITNKVYEEGKYTAKESCIIATGFSTVSATFMIIVAKSLGFLETHWGLYFIISVIVTFVVTALTARIYPLSKKSDSYTVEQGDIEVAVKKDKFKTALKYAEETALNAPNLIEGVIENFLAGMKLVLNMAPSLMAIGTLGLIIAKYTPIFDFVGYLFYPFTLITGLQEPLLVAKSLSMSIAEMFLPVVPVEGLSFVPKFVVGVVCVSEILFFSGSIPCILATSIPLSIKDYIIIWFERVALSILITAPICHLLFGVLHIGM